MASDRDYYDMTDEQLLDRVIKYRQALRVVWNEGRKLHNTAHGGRQLNQTVHWALGHMTTELAALDESMQILVSEKEWPQELADKVRVAGQGQGMYAPLRPPEFWD